MKKEILIILSMLPLSFFAGCGGRNAVEKTDEYQKAKQATASGIEYVSEKTSDFVQNNEQAQKALETANQVIDTAKEKTSDLIEKTKSEAKQQYDTLKKDAKEGIKSKVNEKIDSAFDAL